MLFHTKVVLILVQIILHTLNVVFNLQDIVYIKMIKVVIYLQ